MAIITPPPKAKATFGPVKLENFLDEVLGLIGTSYLWGGKDPEKDKGIDCSGVVTHALMQAGGPDWRQTHNSERLFDELELPGEQESLASLDAEMDRLAGILVSTPPEARPAVRAQLREVGARASKAESRELAPGDLVFYQRHVMVHIASGLVVGACDGGSKTTTLEIAAHQGARVKTRRRYDYRRDVLGFRRIPFLVPRGDMSHGVR